LDDVIGDGFDKDAAKFYAAGILEGLTYMHRCHDRRHIIHRDLKPQNVMMNNLGYPVLIDLGFCKSILLVTNDGFRAGSHHFCIASSKICPGQNALKGIDLPAKGDCWEENKVLSLELYSLAVEVDNIIGGNIVKVWRSIAAKCWNKQTVHSWTSFECTMF
jgi:serine/threonine protein kinase